MFSLSFTLETMLYPFFRAQYLFFYRNDVKNSHVLQPKLSVKFNLKLQAKNNSTNLRLRSTSKTVV